MFIFYFFKANNMSRRKYSSVINLSEESLLKEPDQLLDKEGVGWLSLGSDLVYTPSGRIGTWRETG
jgi:hypothetical protein